jgi:hypothetical protein
MAPDALDHKFCRTLEREARPLCFAFHSRASASDGEGLSGNAFSYRSMAVWMTNISHGVNVIEHLPIGYDPGINKRDQSVAGALVLSSFVAKILVALTFDDRPLARVRHPFS